MRILIIGFYLVYLLQRYEGNQNEEIGLSALLQNFEFSYLSLTGTMSNAKK